MTDEDKWQEVWARLDALEILISGSLLDHVEAGSLDGEALIRNLRHLETDYRQRNEHAAAIQIFRLARRALEKQCRPDDQLGEP